MVAVMVATTLNGFTSFACTVMWALGSIAIREVSVKFSS